MRYAEIGWVLLMGAVATGGTGCASRVPAPSTPTVVAAAASGPVGAASSPATPAEAAAPPALAPVDPTVQRAFDDAGRAMRAGQVEQAQRAYRALIQTHPDLGGPHANLALIERQSGHLPQAAAELETAVRLSPRQPLYFNELGVTYRQQGQFDKARQAYEHAIELDANYAPAYLNLGILNDLYLGNAQRALELYDRYLALSPGGDSVVAKWVVELKKRKTTASSANAKEKS